MAEPNGEIAVRDPDSLVKEIERTRESLARTIDALTERVSPQNVARRAMGRAREQMARPEAKIAGGVALAAAAAAVYVMWRRRN